MVEGPRCWSHKRRERREQEHQPGKQTTAAGGYADYRHPRSHQGINFSVPVNLRWVWSDLSTKPCISSTFHLLTCIPAHCLCMSCCLAAVAGHWMTPCSC